MTSPAAIPDPSELLAHETWLRALALRLVRDEAAADDIVQETWRAALTHSVRDPRKLRAWLGRVATNAARQSWRSEGRRRTRERSVARTSWAPSTADVVARTELHRRLVDAVLALDEPFRHTLLLRYFDDLTPKQIAAREHVPAATVRTRLKRGLERLRAALDDREGSRRAWALALVPLATGGGSAVAVTKTVPLVIVVTILLLGAGLLVVPRLAERRDVSDETPPTRAEVAGASATLVGRAAEAVPAPVPEPISVTPASDPWTLRGRVVDDAGDGVSEATVMVAVLGAGPALLPVRGACRADGSFAIAIPALAKRGRIARAPLRLEAMAWAPRLAGGPGGSRWLATVGVRDDLTDLQPRIVLAARPMIRGRIVDGRGTPVPAMLESGRRGTGVTSGAPTWADGCFRITVPVSGSYELRGRAPGIGATGIVVVDVPVDGDVDAGDLVLRGDGFIEGTAVFPDGTPVPFHTVTCSVERGDSTTGGLRRSRTLTDARGRFRLAGLMAGRYLLGARGPDPDAAAPSYETGETAARLVVPTRRVRVLVQDAEGRPVPGATYAVRRLRFGQGEEVVDRESGRVSPPDGACELWAEPGARALVAASVEGSQYGEAELVFTEDSPWDRELVLTLVEAAGGHGSLRVDVSDSGGRAIEAAVVRVQTAVAREALEGFYAVDRGAQGRIPAVPVGRWVVEVVPGRGTDDPPVELYHPIHAEVDIRVGEETALRLEATPAARLGLLVRRPPGGSARMGRIQATLQATGTSAKPRSAGAFVTGQAELGWRLGGLGYDELGIGATAFDPGPYTLHVRLDGKALWEGAVELVAGRVTRVELDPDTGRATVGLDDADPPAEEDRAGAEPGGQVLEGPIQGSDEGLETILAQVAEEAGLELVVTPAAAKAMDGVGMTFTIEGLKLRTVLALLLGPQELAWRIEGDLLHVGTATEHRR